MELTGKLKEEVEKCETREDAKSKIQEAGIVLNDDELDSLAGGLFIPNRRRSGTKMYDIEA